MKRWAPMIVLLAGCGGTTPSPDLTPAAGDDRAAFQNGDVLSYVLKDRDGRSIGRAHAEVTRSDGQLRLVTRVAYGEPAAATVEYAMTLRDDFTLVGYKRLSSTDGRLQFVVRDGFITLVTDIAEKRIPYDPASRALVVGRDDFLGLAAALRHSGLTPGQSGRLTVLLPETGEVDGMPVQVFADAQRRTLVKMPDGRVTLDGRGYITRYETTGGSTFELQATPSDPPRLLAVPTPARYDRPRSATWDDHEVLIDVERGRYAGVLSVPKLRSHWPSSLAPGVIVLGDLPETNRHGFGHTVDYGRWELADRLAEEGFAVLRLDDRGVGTSRSEVESAQLTVEDRVRDAEAIYDFLKRQPHVDPDKIIVIGHGFGAIDATLFAGRFDLTALVLMAPAYRSVASVLAEREVKLHGATPAEAERRINLMLAVFRGNEAAEAEVLERLLRLYRHARARLLTATDVDTNAALAKVTEPIAVFQGLKDFETSWKYDAQALEQSVNKRKRGQAKLFVYADVDHLMKTTNAASTLESYADRGRRLEPKFLDDLVGWLREQAK